MAWHRSDRQSVTGRRHGRRAPSSVVIDGAGNAAVEFALLAPVFLALILGTLVYGLYFGVAHSVQQLASEAARASVPGLTEQERSALARQFVTRALASYGLLKPDALRVATGFDAADPNLFKVTLTYDASSLGLNLFQAILPLPTNQLARSATIRRGGA